MTGTLALTGSGLLLLGPADPTRRRLAWLAAHRLPVVPVERPLRSRLSLRRRVFLAGGSVGVLAGAVAGPIPGLLALLAVMVAGRVWRQLAAERVRDADQTRLAEVVAAIAAEHAAGAGLGAAFRQAADAAGRWQPALLRAAQLAAVGADPARGLINEPLLVPLAVAIALAGRTGAGVADVLARVRADIASVQDCRRAVAEAVAGPRSSAVLLSLLPVVGLAMGAVLGAQPWQVLTRTPAGLAVLTVGVLLELAGLVWTGRLTR